jgi:hypothetical protein
MLVPFTVLIILAVGYAQYNNGLFSAIAMAIMVVLAGLVAFNFWEPVADVLEPAVRGTFLSGTEDLLTLACLFCLALGLMRFGANYISPQMIEYHGAVQRVGAGVIGMATGYLVSGFILCMLETLPLHEQFLGFEPRVQGESGLRSILPSDRVWLALMRHAGAYPLNSTEDSPEQPYAYDRFRTFDRDATFELRYQRYRRYGDQRGALPYLGELDRAIYRGQ